MGLISEPTITPRALTRHERALNAIRQFMIDRSCYDILPESFRLIVLSDQLSIQRALVALQTNGVVSAPVYNAEQAKFTGMFTLTDVIHVIQYYYKVTTSYAEAGEDVEMLTLERLRDIETLINVPPPPTVSIHPDQSLLDACLALVRTHARRLPLIDLDDETGKETILSVLTQYRVLKFISINCAHDASRMNESVGELGVGIYVSGYQQKTVVLMPRSNPNRVIGRARSRSSARSGPSSETASPAQSTVSVPSAEQTAALPAEDDDDWAAPLATASLQTSVFDVVHVFSDLGISAVPVLDRLGRVINLYESVDVVDLIRSATYNQLDLKIEDALAKRPRDFPGVVTCSPDDSLASILQYIRERRVHRFVIVEPGEWEPSPLTEEEEEMVRIGHRPTKLPGRLVGMLSLSDILRHLVGTSPDELRGKDIPLYSPELLKPQLDSRLDTVNEGGSGSSTEFATPAMTPAVEKDKPLP